MSLPRFTIPVQLHHHTVRYVPTRGHNPSTSTSPYCALRFCPGSQSFYKYITILYITSLPGVRILLQVLHHTVLYVSARGYNPSTSTSPYCTWRLCPGSQFFYNYITILYFTSLPWVTLLLQVYHHTVHYVSARGHNPPTSTTPYCTLRLCPGSQSFYKYITILYFTSLPGVTILLQVHHHTVLYVSVRGHNPSTSTSPPCTLRLCPGSQCFYKYIAILYITSLPGVTILLQVLHHTVLYVSARGHNPSTSTSPYCTLRLSSGSQSFYKYITILYVASLPGVTILLQVHHHAVLYVSARGHNPSKATSPYCTLRLCSGSQSFYKYITILYITSLPGIRILLQVLYHTVLYVSARGHNPSTSTSPYCTLRLCPGSQSFYNYITILYFTSLPGVTILVQVHHHTVHYVSALGHNPPTSTSPCCTLRLCSGWQSFYKYITILYVASLLGVTILLQVHHHTVLYVSARGHNPSTSTSPYFTIRLCQGSQSFYKYITIMYFTSLPGITIPLQVHHHTVLYVSARGHNPSTSTSWCCTLRLCRGSQSFYKYITILYFTSLPGVTILLQAHHHTVLYAFARGHNPSRSTSPYCTLRLCPGSQSSYKYFTILCFTSLLGVTILLQVHHHTVHYVSARGHNPPSSTSPFCTIRLCSGSQSFYKYITILYFTSLPGVTILS